MKPHSPHSFSKAFTVLEILVATALLSVISGLLFSVLSQTSDAWISGQQSAERQRAARLALELISRDLSQAFTSRISPPINFFGFPTNIYFIAIVPTQDGRSSDMGEMGYRLDYTTGKLYRYSTPPTNDVTWNPRDINTPDSWKWPDLTNSFLYTSEADTLVAEGVVDLQFYYSGPISNNATAWTNSLQSWCTTNVAGSYQADTLPAVVDVDIITLPISKWKAAGSPGYANLTNQFSRIFQSSIRVGRGGY